MNVNICNIYNVSFFHFLTSIYQHLLTFFNKKVKKLSTKNIMQIIFYLKGWWKVKVVKNERKKKWNENWSCLY